MLNGDFGRSPIGVLTDNYDNNKRKGEDYSYCAKLKAGGKCLIDIKVRSGCSKTCNVYIDDEIYRPGEDRRFMFGF